MSRLQILTYDELPNSYDVQVQLLELGAGWGVFDFEHVNRARKIGYPAADYFGVYAVENNEVLAKVEVIRVDFETRKGSQIMSGISGVVTRRDRSQLGLARKLVLDVHQRQRDSGIKYCLLWAGRNNKAHNLYESLGYVDIFDPSVAVVKTQKNSANTCDELRIRKATIDDSLLMDELHSKMTAGRLGFIRRCKNFMQIVFDLEFDKPDSYRIFLKDDRPVGYAYFQETPIEWIRSFEVVVVERQYSNSIVSLLEEEAKGNWLAFSNSFVFDERELLEERGYAFSNYTYGTLMACDLEEQTRQEGEEMKALLGANDPRFVCEGYDHF